MPTSSVTVATLTSQQFLERLGIDGHLWDVRAIKPRLAWYKRQTLSAAVEGTLGLGDRRARVQIGLTTDFPARLPIITVNPHGEFAELPHVEPDGAVCFRPRDEPLLNHDDPYGIVREALQLAAETLYAGLYGNRAAEFANEIVAYWRAYYPKAATVMGVLTPDDRARLVTAFFDCGVRCAVGDTPASFAAFRQFRNVDKLTFVNAVYVPINPAASDPQFHPRHLATAHGLNVHVTPVLRQDQDLWRSIEQHCRAREVLVVLGVQRPSGRRGLVGLIVRRREGAHPFDAQAIDDSRIAPCYVDPVDRAYLLPRGGANTDLGRCRVLVVGCGAVGGYVAMNLARAGLGTIDLMDPDSFEAANTFRHACGRAYVDYRKVVGLKLEIERLLPFVKVRTHQTDVLAWMREQPEGFRAYDLIVLAIGNPTVELRVNAVIAADPKAPPAIFTWLEPLGLGGHALVTHIGASSAGCFQCLYERGEDGTLVCRAAYAHPGGRYTRDMMGCGSQHMSFGDLDAQRAAMVVARRALDVLQGNLSESELVSWKGNADAFRAAGFKTTECYERSPPEERLPGLMLVRTGCPLCKPA